MEPTKMITNNFVDIEQEPPLKKKMIDKGEEFQDTKAPTECRPLKSLEELDMMIEIPPEWLNNITPIEKRSETVVQNVLSDCHVNFSNYKQRPRLDAKFIPKTLVCHDYKGGYLEDRHLAVEVETGNQYTFYNWSHIDIFVYFSHHFITIPPLCWINAAHQKGVKILGVAKFDSILNNIKFDKFNRNELQYCDSLNCTCIFLADLSELPIFHVVGTIITEFEDGTKICGKIFKDSDTVQHFIRKLCKITEMFKLDGWLLNIENPLEDTAILKEFVKELTSQLHSINPETLIIWYDSVVENGNLEWQNELNEKNLCFFERCDGIFLNYVWTEEKLLKSIEIAKERSMDVYVGVDIFGRNTFGGGQFNSYKAAEVIRRHSLSMAIFAPGWTHESIVQSDNAIGLMEHFFNKDCAFWNSLWPYLYTHPITKYFKTSFYRGADTNRFSLFLQQTQLSKIVHPKISYLVPNYTEIPTLERKCHCIRLEYENNTPTCFINKHGLKNDPIIHNLFVCDIKAVGEVMVFFKKKAEPFGILGWRLVVSLENNSRHVVTLNGKRRNSVNANSSVTQVNPLSQENELVTILNKQYSVARGVSEMVVYVFNVPMCHILEIGAILEEGDAVCLESFGIEPSTRKLLT